ncbi:type IV secretion system protein, partial [Escherichia coli]|uniref:type IV secretion system protein n=1 Tax=Escherichia coli TaxID=562 RepID=UPI0020773C44
MNVVSEFITTINTVVQSGAASNAAKIAKAISPVFVAAVLLYIVYVAYEITYSQRDIILSEVTKLIASLSLVGAFTYTAPYYSQYVIPFVMHAGSDLSNALTGTGDVATSVDGLWEKLSTIMDNFISSKVQELSMTDIGGYIGAYAIWGIGYAGGAILILYTTIFLCISTFMVGLLLATGIIFICFSFFPTTRSMFTSWCGSCCLFSKLTPPTKRICLLLAFLRLFKKKTMLRLILLIMTHQLKISYCYDYTDADIRAPESSTAT